MTNRAFSVKTFSFLSGICCTLVIFCSSLFGYAQKINEKGLLNIRNYSPKEYGAQPQNLCALQDNRGIMYFGNNSGILEYDGFYWRIIKVTNETSVSALAADNNNTIYAGAENDLGKLVPGEKGSLEFKSLVSLLPAEQREFGRIHRILSIGDTVFFQARKFIFRWVNNKFISPITTPQTFHLAFKVNNQVWVRVRDAGIFRLRENELVQIKNSEMFATELVYEIIPFRGKLLFVTSTLGLFEYTAQGEFVPVFQEIRNAYSAININDTYLAIGTFDNGMALLDKNLVSEYKIGLSNGLQDGTVNSLFIDNEQNLWLLMNRGIAKIEVISPISIHNYDTGLKGTVEDIVRYKKKLYVATQNGVFFFKDEITTNSKFDQMPRLDIDCYSLAHFVTGKDTSLLVAGVDAVYDISGTSAVRLAAAAPWKIAQSAYNPSILIVANDDGLSYMKHNGKTWSDNIYIQDLPDQIYNFAQNKNGQLWLGTADKGVIRVNRDFFNGKKPDIKRYEAAKGIPKGPVYVYCDNRDNLYVGTDNGVYVYDRKTDRFVKDKNFSFSNRTYGVHRISKDLYGNFWISLFYPDNTYDIFKGYAGNWDRTPFLRFNSEVFQAAYHDKKITWLGSATGLLRYDSELAKEYKNPYKVNLRRLIRGKEVVFSGTFFNQQKAVIPLQGTENVFDFSYSRNNFIFEFSASSYFDEKSTRYAFRMDGLEENWSEWSTTPRAEYNYVPEGDYVFMVKARNIYGTQSEVMKFTFSIRPPWYRTWWAYVSYIVIFILIIRIAILVSTRSLKRIIEERTNEIVHQKEEIEHQKEALEEKNKDILDSIKYAKRIQDAILPSEQRMSEDLKKDMFVLFKPKDIVSGDFYWMHSAENETLFAAVDCTGHGVPGAFVSLIGYNGLNRTVHEAGLTQPARVLDNLALLVEDAFKQKGSSDVKDGMDISICSIQFRISDPELNSDSKFENRNSQAKLQWSGANNPLWIVSKKEVKMLSGEASRMRVEHFRDLLLTEIKPDKQPIGKFDARKPYTNFAFELNAGDCIYIFTDGYADQFGGRNGKKFKYAQMKSAITTLYNLTMVEQGREMERIFETWKADYQQVDDVCVIGVRI